MSDTAEILVRQWFEELRPQAQLEISNFDLSALEDAIDAELVGAGSVMELRAAEIGLQHARESAKRCLGWLEGIGSLPISDVRDELNELLEDIDAEQPKVETLTVIKRVPE